MKLNLVSIVRCFYKGERTLKITIPTYRTFYSIRESIIGSVVLRTKKPSVVRVIISFIGSYKGFRAFFGFK